MRQQRRPFVAGLICALSVASYLVSFCLPTYEIGAKREVEYGGTTFLACIFTLFNVQLCGFKAVFLWLANPMFRLSIYHFVRGTTWMAVIAAFIATAIAATAPFLFPTEHMHLLSGYYCWMSSMDH